LLRRKWESKRYFRINRNRGKRATTNALVSSAQHLAAGHTLWAIGRMGAAINTKPLSNTLLSINQEATWPRTAASEARPPQYIPKETPHGCPCCPRPDRPGHPPRKLAGAFAMFAYGAALSFDVLHSIASAAGLSPVLAWLWPLGFETFMAVAAVAVLAEQRTRPGRTPWYPWVLTALAAGSSIALNFGHPYIPLDPPPRLLVACVYGVPPICAPFAWHLFLLRLAHRRQDDRQD
jgi:hypothetical protein